MLAQYLSLFDNNTAKTIHGKRKMLGGDIIQVIKSTIVLMLDGWDLSVGPLVVRSSEGRFRLLLSTSFIKTIELSIE